MTAVPESFPGPEADPDAFARQLHHLMGELPAVADGLIELAWNNPGEAAVRHARQFRQDELEDAVAEFEARSSEGRNVFVAAGLRDPSCSRFARASAQSVSAVTALWADFDEPGAASRAFAHCQALNIPPTLAVQTGSYPHQRAQFWWYLDEPCSDLERTSDLLADLARVLGGDRAVRNVDRVMRAAGSVAHAVKPGRITEATRIVEEWSVSRPPYAIEQIARALQGSSVQSDAARGNLAGVLDFNSARRVSQAERLEATFEPGSWHANARDFVARMVREGSSDETIAALAPAFVRDTYTLEQTRRELLRFAEGARAKGWARVEDAPADAAGISLVNPAAWLGKQPPLRRFTIGSGSRGIVPDRQLTLLTGSGGSGKSLLGQQACTAAAIGQPLLGLETKKCVSVYFTCEDDVDELHRRQAAICEAFDVDFDALDGKLYLASLVGGVGNELATFDPHNRLTPTDGWFRLREVILKVRPGLVVLDNVAHLFAGNENVRNQVAAFCGLLNGLAAEADTAIVLIAHPNKAGGEFSGSTAWENQVRSRIFLQTPTAEDGAVIDPDRRTLSLSKTNYARLGETVEFRWYRWAFVENTPAAGSGSFGARQAEKLAEERFLACLDQATEERRTTSASKSAANYAPRVFLKMPCGKGMSFKAFDGALNRLLSEGVIVNDQPVYKRPNRTWALGLARAQTPAQSLHKAAHEACTNPHIGEE